MPDLQTQAEALLSQLPQPASKPIADFGRLSYADTALILKLDRDGRTQTAIAQLVGCSQPTVSKVLHDFSESTDLAKRKANSLALPAVESLERAWKAAEKTGKSGPQEAILKIAGVLGDESQGPRVIVQIGVKDSDVSINLSPSAFASDAPRQGAVSD